VLDCIATELEIAEHARGMPLTVKARMGGWGNDKPEVLAMKLNYLAESFQARPVADDVGLQGRINRMTDRHWWCNNIRRGLLREQEAGAFNAGAIKKSAACYASEFAMKRVKARHDRNREVLAHLSAVNDAGQAVGLLDCVDASVSNPKHRRTELMTRCKGFEDVARFMGHAAVFLTLTAPSMFHRFNRLGNTNKNWNGATPKDAHAYFNSIWAKIRAEWKRRGIAPYGFRVAEPHHDGCPHWHVLLFVPSDQVGWFNATRFVADGADFGAGLIGVAGQYALEESGGEPGAIDARFTAKIIDAGDVRDANTGALIESGAGSATGYIAKYISKNLDGFDAQNLTWGLDHDSGMWTNDASARVRVWASVWGIRQFQQIGGPSVTVWRQLRSYKGEFPEQLELFRDCKTVAEEGKWAAFWMLQGGAETPRSEYVRPMYSIDSIGKYGDDVERVVGVQRGDVDYLITRLTDWQIVPAGSAEHIARGMRLDASEARTPGTAAMLKMIQAIEQAKGDFSPSEGEAEAPWARVNNCTGETNQGSGDNCREIENGRIYQASEHCAGPERDRGGGREQPQPPQFGRMHGARLPHAG
jgi:hypothetical protein